MPNRFNERVFRAGTCAAQKLLHFAECVFNKRIRQQERDDEQTGADYGVRKQSAEPGLQTSAWCCVVWDTRPEDQSRDAHDAHRVGRRYH